MRAAIRTLSWHDTSAILSGLFDGRRSIPDEEKKPAGMTPLALSLYDPKERCEQRARSRSR
jgi:hypothetical protein